MATILELVIVFLDTRNQLHKTAVLDQLD